MYYIAVDMGESNRYSMGEFERAVLVVLIRLGENAYGALIRRTLSERLDRDVAIGAVYTTLQRLEDKGYVSSFMGEPTPERGDRAKRFFRIEAPGEEALAKSQARSDVLLAIPALDGAR